MCTVHNTKRLLAPISACHDHNLQTSLPPVTISIGIYMGMYRYTIPTIGIVYIYYNIIQYFFGTRIILL